MIKFGGKEVKEIKYCSNGGTVKGVSEIIHGGKSIFTSGNFLTFTSIGNSGYVMFGYVSGDVYYRTSQNGDWINYSKNTRIDLIKDGIVQFKGTNVITDSEIENHFKINGTIKASGSVTSLTDGKGTDGNVALQESCYDSMFADCQALVSAPELPAKTLSEFCYQKMFKGCTGLTEAPILAAEDLEYHCYSEMFKGCSNLSSVTTGFTSWYAEATTEWLSGTSATGTFNHASSLLKPSSYSGSTVCSGWVTNPPFANTYDGLRLTAQEDGSYVKLSKNGSFNATFETSLNEGEEGSWTEYEYDTPIYLSKNQTVCWRINYPGTYQRRSMDNYVQFILRGKIAATGNCMSLLDKTLKSVTVQDYGFYKLFADCYYKLTHAPDLPATTLGIYCYASMFHSCFSISKAPSLPASIMKLSCYDNMFGACYGIKRTPDLNSTSLGSQCYKNMFMNCTSLRKASGLPATSLTEHCYDWMFGGCTSLEEIPELPSPTLSYYGYYGMFYGCTKLSSVSVKFTAWNSSATTNWLNGVAASGTFTCPSALDTTTRNTSRVPVGWTVVNK